MSIDTFVDKDLTIKVVGKIGETSLNRDSEESTNDHKDEKDEKVLSIKLKSRKRYDIKEDNKLDYESSDDGELRKNMHERKKRPGIDTIIDKEEKGKEKMLGDNIKRKLDTEEIPRNESGKKKRFSESDNENIGKKTKLRGERNQKGHEVARHENDERRRRHTKSPESKRHRSPVSSRYRDSSRNRRRDNSSERRYDNSHERRRGDSRERGRKEIYEERRHDQSKERRIRRSRSPLKKRIDIQIRSHRSRSVERRRDYRSLSRDRARRRTTNNNIFRGRRRSGSRDHKRIPSHDKKQNRGSSRDEKRSGRPRRHSSKSRVKQDDAGKSDQSISQKYFLIF